MIDPVLKDLSRYERQVDEDEAHDEWVASVLGPVLEALQDIDARNNLHVNLIKETAFKDALQKAAKIVHEYVYEEYT